MKKSILFIVMLLLPFSLFSYEISFNKKFSVSVNPDLLTTNVNIQVSDEKESFVNEHIEAFNVYIKNNTTVIKKNGNFTLSPKYKYYKTTQEFLGYVGVLRYQVESKIANDLNKFMNELLELKDELDKNSIKLTLSSVSWKTSTKLYENSVDKLRLNAITWIDKYAASLKNILSKDCKVQKININNVNGGHPIAYARTEMMSTSSRRISNVAPINTNATISINPNFILECK
jgi:uncharacterized protein YggE